MKKYLWTVLSILIFTASMCLYAAPKNIGREIYITGFMIGWKVCAVGGSFEEAQRLASGYPTNVVEVQAWFKNKDTTLDFPK